MLLPSIFGENLFDDWMDFSFPEIPDVDKTLYGKHAKNMMKTDVKETEKGIDRCRFSDLVVCGTNDHQHIFGEL